MTRYVYIAAGLILGVLATVLWQKYTFKAAPKLAVTTVKLESRPASWAQPVDPDFVLYKMSDSLYRSALPRVQDVEWLQQNKIQTVINFYQKPDSLWLRDTGIEQYKFRYARTVSMMPMYCGCCVALPVLNKKVKC